MKYQVDSGFWPRRGGVIGPVLLGLILLAGCSGDDGGSSQQEQALVPAGSASIPSASYYPEGVCNGSKGNRPNCECTTGYYQCAGKKHRGSTRFH